MRMPLVLAFLVVPAIASADDYRPGIVPEGNNAFVHARRELRIAPFGESSVGLTEHTELSTYLAADAVLFPNLLLEHQIDESDHYAMSIVLGAGAGALPMAVGFFLPFGHAAVAGGGVGFAWASIQSATAIMSLRAPDRALSVSINAGGFAMEGGMMAIGGAVGVGDSGAGGGAAPAEMHGVRTAARPRASRSLARSVRATRWSRRLTSGTGSRSRRWTSMATVSRTRASRGRTSGPAGHSAVARTR